MMGNTSTYPQKAKLTFHSNFVVVPALYKSSGIPVHYLQMMLQIMKSQLDSNFTAQQTNVNKHAIFIKLTCFSLKVYVKFTCDWEDFALYSLCSL